MGPGFEPQRDHKYYNNGDGQKAFPDIKGGLLSQDAPRSHEEAQKEFITFENRIGV